MIKFLKKLENQHPKLFEFVRFLIIGGISTVIDFLVMGLTIYLLNRSQFDYQFLRVFLDKDVASVSSVVLGTGVGFVVGLIFNYIFSLIFVYKSYDQSAKGKKGFLLFLIFSVIGLLIQTVGVYIGYSLLHINEWIVKAFFVLVVLIFNYFTRKKYIFKNNDNNQNEV